MSRRVTLLAFAIVVSLLAAGCSGLRATQHYSAGRRALDRGDAALAVRELERAARLRPDVSEIHNELGLAYAAAGRPEEMRAAFERAVALDCANESARHNLRAVEAGPQAP